MNYDAFLRQKVDSAPTSPIKPSETHPSLYDFQAAIVRWAVRKGRSAVFADCGLGKTRIQLEWIRQMGKRSLIVAPLCVADQTIAEAEEIGIRVRFARRPMRERGVWITNYEKLKHFIGERYDAIVLDESSILKSIDGRTRTMLLQEFTHIPYRLCCTATPSPNDIAELANHSQFLGVLKREEMLARFFVHDNDGWRLKGHAQDKFWQWLVGWALYLRMPSDLGFEDEAFKIPPLMKHTHIVTADYVPEGMLFNLGSGGIGYRSAARRATITEKTAEASALIRSMPGHWVVWCGLNDEGRKLKAELGKEAVLIEGQDSESARIERHAAWRSGVSRVLITKPSIFGWGMNWQHCSQVLFLGLSDSYESFYQAVRRCWRFGQSKPTQCHVVISDAETMVLKNIARKQADADALAAGLVGNMKSLEMEAVRMQTQQRDAYKESTAKGLAWTMMLGDSCKRLKEVETGSVGLSVFSPPFASLYTYTASERDLGNSADYDEFFEHFNFIIEELLRVTMPCRRAAVHVQQVTTTLATHGIIGWRDFRADTVKAFQAKGWIYDGEVVIDKDPQAQAIRTHSKALLFVQKNKDSAWCRPAMADYILLFRAPGENPVPIKCDLTNEEWILWARPIWYGIKESDVLNKSGARENKDERHICPLQLETIRRCLRLWSNPGELILSPFAGIGSEGYEAIRNERRFIGIELKESYYRVAIKNLKQAASEMSLFEASDA